MSVLSQVGQFAASTLGATTTVNCNFQGKAIIFFTHGKTGNAATAGASFSMGFSDETNHQTISWSGDDAVATTNVARANGGNARSLQILTDGTPTFGTGGSISGVTFNASTFVVTFNATPASAWLVDFILLGGTDITNAFVGSVAEPIATGTFNVTNVGFKGDMVLLLMTNQGATGSGVHALWNIGMAVSPSKRWGFAGAAQDGQTTSANVNGQTIMRTDQFVVGQTQADAVNIVGDFVQFTSTGFDINYTTIAATGFLLHYLVIKGGTWDCGTSAKPTGATAQTVTGEAFQPLLLGLFTSSPTASNSNTTNNVSSFGASDGSNQCYANAFHNDAINTVAKSSGSASACLLDRDGVNNPSATFTSFNPDGWTITWGATGSARQVGWFTVGNPFKVPELLDAHRSGHQEPHRLVSF